MNSRRPSTSSPISVRNISSACSASFSVTCNSVRCCGSSVVVPQLLGVHLAQPLEPRHRHPLLAEPADLGHQLAQVRQVLRVRRRAPARTAPAARGRPPAAAAPGRPRSNPASFSFASARFSACTSCHSSSVYRSVRHRVSRPSGSPRSAAGDRVVARPVPCPAAALARAERVHLVGRVEPVLLRRRTGRGTSGTRRPSRRVQERSSVCPRRSRFTTAVSASSSTGQQLRQVVAGDRVAAPAASGSP